MALGTSLKENCCLLAVGCRQILVDLLEIRRFLGYEPGSAKKIKLLHPVIHNLWPLNLIFFLSFIFFILVQNVIALGPIGESRVLNCNLC